ncbi:DNA-binding transcriptional regulator, LysR family [Paenibacillus sp. UNCCL117]|uniref:LysR family transcriptional regulator n=1 Tax=unclassified Paenibacillus TaxID=185978 RepID=UPI00087FAD4D|nr:MULTISPECIES: LysR family transcriptional regulator [unclassified Paenibacillus]SDB98521.1 DNA-binding transcriptional regulator, LysR family [Paenibacillus sp. cl123]SFW68962.1 DNA-binding transcriptional regulator, LysR family [Paenibacillus sp. UNCCL117]
MSEHLEGYRVFYCAAKAGSLTKAAEQLFLTQPAVTHAIKQLESKLGGPLFFRTAKGVQLTGEGQVLFTYIEQGLQLIHTGERLLADMRQLEAGDIRISAGDTLCKHYLLPSLASFHLIYPGIRIHVTNRTTLETIALLKEGAIDIGIVNLPLPADKLPVAKNKLHIREVMQIQDCFVAGAAFKHLSEIPISMEALLSYPIILLESGSSIRHYIDMHAAGLGVRLKPEIELGSIDLLVDFARTGLGISCVIRNFIAQELASQQLYELQLTEPIPPRHIGVVSLSGVPLSSAAQRFVDRLLDGTL